MRAMKINESVTNATVVDKEKLKKYADAIKLICNGEYGEVYYNERQIHIFVCVGDSNPFDIDYLIDFIKEGVGKNWKSNEEIQVTVEAECGPPDEDGWEQIN